MATEITLNTCNDLTSLISSNQIIEVPMNKAQKSNMLDLLHYLPQATASSTLSNAWVAKFPKGLGKANMIRLKDGGYGTPLKVNGEFKDSASLHSLGTQGTIYGIFTLLSAVTGQYFLSRIDNQLALVNSKLDDVLNFLYGENRAELLAEIFFVKRTYENFASIMENDYQRTATISGLQSAQKIAVKDLEFYLSDIEKMAGKQVTDFKTLCADETSAWKALKCVELAIQTFVMANILEIYLSENYDESYTEYVRQMLKTYMRRCDTSIISSFAAIDAKFSQYHQSLFENAEARQKYRAMIRKTLAPYKGEAESPLRTMLENALNALQSESVCYLSNDGKVYIPASHQ